MQRLIPALVFVTAWAAISEAQTPQPFPRPGVTQAPPPPAAPRPATQTSPAPADPNAPSAATLSVPVYPGAQFLASYDAGRGQRYYLFGTPARFDEVVGYYRTQLD